MVIQRTIKQETRRYMPRRLNKRIKFELNQLFENVSIPYCYYDSGVGGPSKLRDIAREMNMIRIEKFDVPIRLVNQIEDETKDKVRSVCMK